MAEQNVHIETVKARGSNMEMLGDTPHDLAVDLAPVDTGILAHTDLNINALLNWIDRISEKLNNGQPPRTCPPRFGIFSTRTTVKLAFDDAGSKKELTLPGFMFQMEEDIVMDSSPLHIAARKDDKILTMMNDAMAGGFAPPQKTKVGLDRSAHPSTHADPDSGT